MRLSDSIETFIKTLLAEDEPEVELKRNELAEYFGCAPSQINYVLATRFSPDHGYLIESRRGGGGHIRIIRKQMDRNEYLMHFFHAVGDAIGESEAKAYLQNLADNGFVTKRECGIIRNALSESALQNVTPAGRETVRAQIFRHILLSLVE